MNCESAAEADVERILAEKPRADGMKRSRPAERMDGGAGFRAERLRRDVLDPALHFGGRAAGEGEKHHAARVRATDDQVRDAVSQGVGFAGACARNDEKRWHFIKRAGPVFDGAALFSIEFGEVDSGHRRAITPRQARLSISASLFLRPISELPELANKHKA